MIGSRGSLIASALSVFDFSALLWRQVWIGQASLIFRSFTLVGGPSLFGGFPLFWREIRGCLCKIVLHRLLGRFAFCDHGVKLRVELTGRLVKRLYFASSGDAQFAPLMLHSKTPPFRLWLNIGRCAVHRGSLLHKLRILSILSRLGSRESCMGLSQFVQ